MVTNGNDYHVKPLNAITTFG